MNIFLHEIKAYRKTTIIWIISITAIFFMFMSIFPNFKEGAEEFEKLLAGYDANFLKAVGFPEDIFSVLSFYSYIFIYVSICGAIQAMNLGLSVISKEIRNKTADFLITKPVSRFKIVTSKILAPIILLGFTNLMLLGVSLLMIKYTGEQYEFETFLKVFSILPFLQLIFFTLGFVIATIVTKIKNVVTLSLGITFSLYVLGMIESISGQEKMRYFIPFKYLNAQYIIINGEYESKFLILGIVMSLVFLLSSYIIYIKKDIHSV